MIPDDLPNVAEWELIDLWRMRQENKESQDYHAAHRKHAEDEILKRMAATDASIMQTDAGPIEATYSNTYAYDSRVVDTELWPLIERDGLEAEYRQFVQHQYKISKTWINRLPKHGREYADVIERMVIATKGSPSLKGPELSALGEYAPREGAQV